MPSARSSSLLVGLLFFAVRTVLVADGGEQPGVFTAVPSAALREMSTDRPDTTESPYTVPAGYFQLEMSFFDYSRDVGGKSEAWSFGLVNFKAGLLPDTDLQLVFDSWTRNRSTETSTGFGDVTLRLKQNLWGNDGGKTALALMPYVKIPTGTELSNGEWEGGLIVPMGISLTDRLSFVVMAEMDIIHDEDAGGHDVEWLHSATLGIELTEQLGTYVELVGIAGVETEYRALFDAGITFAVTENLIFDTGVRVGLNRAAEDLGVFTGMSIRF